MVNSRNHLVSSTPQCFGREDLHTRGRTFSRSYGAILPSSFTRVLSSACVFSTCPPVSVSGTAVKNLELSDFSWKRGICSFAPLAGHSPSRLSNSGPDLPNPPTYSLRPGHPTPGSHSLLRHRIAIPTSTGIFTRFPSTTLLSLALGADSPCPD